MKAVGLCRNLPIDHAESLVDLDSIPEPEPHPNDLHFGALTAANLRSAHAWIESGSAIGKAALDGIAN